MSNKNSTPKTSNGKTPYKRSTGSVLRQIERSLAAQAEFKLRFFGENYPAFLDDDKGGRKRWK